MAEKFLLKVKNTTYTREELELKTEEELETFKTYCSSAIQEISIKKGNYRNSNTDGYNSTEYWNQMNRYKVATLKYQQALTVLNEIIKSRHVVSHQKEQSWYYHFYENCKKAIPSWIISKVIKTTNENTGYTLEK